MKNEQTLAEPGEPVSRVDGAYDWLLAEITGFRLRVGRPLSENKIAARLGISRTPVREALLRLEKEGLVRRTDNARFTVSLITSSEVDDACDLLEVLDTYVFRRAASKLTGKDAAALRTNVDRMVAAAAQGDRSQWADADIAFHRLVNRIAGNALIAGTVKETRRRIQRFWLRAGSTKRRLETCSEEHRVLAEAMIDGNYEAIEPAVVEHISHMRHSILNMIANASLFFGVDE